MLLFLLQKIKLFHMFILIDKFEFVLVFLRVRMTIKTPKMISERIIFKLTWDRLLIPFYNIYKLCLGWFDFVSSLNIVSHFHYLQKASLCRWHDRLCMF